MTPATVIPDAVSAACFPVWGGTADVVVTGCGGAARAEELLRDGLAGFDRACSRFRVDSEIRELTRRAGSAVQVSAVLAEALDAAMRAAQLTDGLVDPTVGRALAELGYDRDFAELPLNGPALTPSRAPGWWRIGWDSPNRTLVLPRGVELDLGATAKALAADRAATTIAAELGGGVLVNLAGDIAVAGPPPVGGWLVAIGDDHCGPDGDTPNPDRADPEPDGPTVAITAGGLATSGTTRRRWRSGGDLRHHIIDPRTGDCAQQVWRTVSVAAANCVDANTASTAAIVLGVDAPRWLTARGLPARLVATDGRVQTVAGWPVDGGAVPA